MGKASRGNSKASQNLSPATPRSSTTPKEGTSEQSDRKGGPRPAQGSGRLATMSPKKKGLDVEEGVSATQSVTTKRLRETPDEIVASASKKLRQDEENTQENEEEGVEEENVGLEEYDVEVEIVAPKEEEERADGNLQLKKFEINDYYDVGTKVNINQTNAPAHIARDIDPYHCEELYDSFARDRFDYASRRMVFAVTVSDNLELGKLAVDDLIGDGEAKTGLKCVIIDVFIGDRR